jgi:hypothetical protein
MVPNLRWRISSLRSVVYWRKKRKKRVVRKSLLYLSLHPNLNLSL